MLNVLRVPQLSLHGTAVVTVASLDPGHSGPISKDGCEGARSSLNALLILHGIAVATVANICLGHQASISKNGCKSTRSGLNVLHILELILHGTTVATIISITPGRNVSAVHTVDSTLSSVSK